MNTLLHLGLAYLLVALASSLFIVCLCIAAGRADEQSEEAMRREQEHEARERLYGGGGWRAP